MRKLNSTQKTLITRAYLTSGNPEITNKVMVALEKLNDYETLWQDATRFINDYSFIAMRYSQELISLNEVADFIKNFK